MNEPAQTVTAAPLPFLGVLRIGGADATGFLQGQLTNDVQLLGDGRTQLAAYNTPQGRVIALMRLKKVDDAIYALLPADLLERVNSLLKRSCCVPRWISISLRLQVGSIATVPALPGMASARAVAFDYQPGRKVIAASPDGWRSITGSALSGDSPRRLDEWLAADIRDGQPQVFTATSEAFIPQMLNLDLIGGISFSKGCYTGQEIVAGRRISGASRDARFVTVSMAGRRPSSRGLHLDGAKVAEVLTSAAWGGRVELLAVTSLDARDRALTLEDGRSAAPLDMAYRCPDQAGTRSACSRSPAALAARLVPCILARSRNTGSGESDQVAGRKLGIVTLWNGIVPFAAGAMLAIAWGRRRRPCSSCRLQRAGRGRARRRASREVIAHRVGEPFGTLVLALAVTVIEGSLIVSMMLSGGRNRVRWPATPCSPP